MPLIMSPVVGGEHEYFLDQRSSEVYFLSRSLQSRVGAPAVLGFGRMSLEAVNNALRGTKENESAFDAMRRILR